MSMLENKSIGRHFLAAATAAAISVEIAQARVMGKLTELVTTSIVMTRDVPAPDMIAIKNADAVAVALADAVTMVGIVLMMATFALAISRGKIATLALCAIAVAFAILSGSIITSSLIAAVPKFGEALAAPIGRDAETIGQIIPEGWIATTASLGFLALTLAVAYFVAKDALTKDRHQAPAGESSLAGSA